jgi:23S rRNA (guanosine2251-2'-O)-methyltransferase
MRLPPRDQLTMGIHALHSLLLHAPDRILHVFADAREKRGRKTDLIDLCEAKGIPISYVGLDLLDKMTGSDSHQSFVAHVKGRQYWNASDFLETMRDKERALVLLLDEIFDPQNFGAILRTAECLGVAGVVWSKNRGADLTPTVAKTSSGASEWLPLIRISNLAETVTQFQKEGFEAVATALKPEAESAFTASFAPKTLLILGSEGEGIQPLILKRSDRTLFIPMQGKIESLNVVQAAAVLLALYNK